MSENIKPPEDSGSVASHCSSALEKALRDVRERCDWLHGHATMAKRSGNNDASSRYHFALSQIREIEGELMEHLANQDMGD